MTRVASDRAYAAHDHGAEDGTDGRNTAGRGRPRHRAGSDTRTRIQEIALELFAEQGYEQTSLREIADRLGVTKAALYYHFKSKEEIVVATVEDFLADIDAMVAWAEQQPRGDAMRRELLQRYSAIVARRFGAIRFFQQNPTGVHKSETGAQFKERMGSVHRLLLDDGESTTAEKIRAMLALVGMHLGAAAPFEDESDATPIEERMDAALDIAYELVDRNG